MVRGHGLKQEHRLKLDGRQGTLLKKNQNFQADYDLEREQEDDLEAEADTEPAEPQVIDELGASDCTLEGPTAETAFDREWEFDLPLIFQLPKSVRPLVLFQIDEDKKVHCLGQKGSSDSDLRTLVAKAIAKHLSDWQVILKEPKDWVKIPCIAGNDGILKLVSEEQAQEMHQQLKSMGSVLKNFAIRLWNGDVITPDAIMNLAQKGKQATRAGALRVAADGDQIELGGETWAKEDWRSFEDTQRKKAAPKNPKKRSGKVTAKGQPHGKIEI
ncbi:MAG: hypothetical protein K1Y36_25760 [Blastocatellia bacterium]|nr:hypothetical protein [Blastocatellia bacterium]HMW03219.1 hypothetical protein [Acidobacteriota bacterium]